MDIDPAPTIPVRNIPSLPHFPHGSPPPPVNAVPTRETPPNDPAALILQGVSGALAAKAVTYDFERQMEGATLLKCSEFGDAVIEHMG